MDDLQKKINLLKHKEQGDISPSDNDLEKSLQYLGKNEAFKTSYKDYYTDVKLSVKEDW